MIVSPNKGVFFIATALMCSASLYGAELSAGDPMARIFVGEPNRLTVPPGFPSGEQVLEPKAIDQQARDCQAGASVMAEGAKSLSGCSVDDATIAAVLAPSSRASNGSVLKSEAVAQPVSTASAAGTR
jgi:hypothetical protein